MPSLKEWLFGSEEKLKKVPTMSGGQEQLFNQLLSLLSGSGGQQGGLGQSLGLLQQYLNPESDIYKNFEQPYLQEFEQQTVPMLAEKFAGAGALSSSGFGQSLGAAGSNLQTQLAQMKSELQRKAIGDILGLTQGTFGVQPFAYQQKSATPGLLAPSLAAFGQGAGSGGLGGLGSLLGGLFGGR